MGFIKLRDELWKIVDKSKESQEEKQQVKIERDEKLKRVSPVIKSIVKYFPIIPGGLIDSSLNFFSESRKELKAERLEFIYREVDKVIYSAGSRQFQFAYRAGHWYGSRPKPDTHIISCTVDFEELSSCNSTQPIVNNPPQPVTLQESAFIEMSIFPSLTGMMFGTLIGGFLGTVASTKNFITWQWLGVLLVNLILSFIAGVLLMRKKDVQSFITIEDLWGGILIGFIVGYTGFQGIIRLLGIPSLSPPSSTNQTALFNNILTNLTNLNHSLTNLTHTMK